MDPDIEIILADLYAELADLSEDVRMVADLILQGDSQAEAAKKLGIPASTVRRRLHDVRKKHKRGASKRKKAG